jgi:hypothetical protein
MPHQQLVVGVINPARCRQQVYGQLNSTAAASGTQQQSFPRTEHLGRRRHTMRRLTIFPLFSPWPPMLTRRSWSKNLLSVHIVKGVERPEEIRHGSNDIYQMSRSPSVPGLLTPRFSRTCFSGWAMISVTSAATLLRETVVPLNGSLRWVTS